MNAGDMSRNTTALKTMVFAILAPGTVAGFTPYCLVFRGREFELGGLRFAGIALMLVGVSVVAWCFRDFVRMGHGTPAPIDPPKVLVVKGLYRFVRNPMLRGSVLTLLGEGTFFESRRLLVCAAGVWLVFHLFIVLYGEAALREKFGPDYAAYRRAVRRRIPTTKPYGG